MSDGLGGAGGRGWKERALTMLATGAEVENKQRESAAPGYKQTVRGTSRWWRRPEGDQIVQLLPRAGRVARKQPSAGRQPKSV